MATLAPLEWKSWDFSFNLWHPICVDHMGLLCRAIAPSVTYAIRRSPPSSTKRGGHTRHAHIPRMQWITKSRSLESWPEGAIKENMLIEILLLSGSYICTFASFFFKYLCSSELRKYVKTQSKAITVPMQWGETCYVKIMPYWKAE